MPNQKSTKKIVKYRKLIGVNIGTVLFGILFIYLIICIIMYLTSTHVTAYEVVSGSLSGNYRYTALSLKTEEVVTAPESGTVTYYAREGAQCGNNRVICSIEENGALTGQEVSAGGTESQDTLTGAESDMSDTLESVSIDSKTRTRLNSVLSTFSMSYHGDDFQDTYDLKADVESTLFDMDISDSDVSVSNSSSLMNICRADSQGIVVYSLDGLEETKPEDVTGELFNQKTYSKTNLRSSEYVNSGDELYKMLTDNTWKLIFPLDSKVATELSEQSSVRFRFLKDSTTHSGDFEVLHNGTEFFGQLTLDKCLIRFASDRYVDIELLLNKKTGLKIPKSAIEEKRFYVIPSDYVIYNEDTSDEIGLIKESIANDGTSTTRHITATVYKKVDNDYYVDMSLFEEGDYVVMKDSTNKYRIAEMASLQGVYNINKGYAVFREVTITDENEEYCIVEDGNVYSLSQYDHIALDADAVTDDEILY